MRNANDIRNIDNHKYLTEKHGKFFCASPWNSLHEGPQGLVSTCCKSRQPIGWSGKQNFEEMFNSDLSKEIRASILQGKMHSNCESCAIQEKDGHAASNRVHGNSMTDRAVVDELVANTDVDGTLHVHKPEWLDLLWTNKCNFSCLGCSPELSSSINNNYKKEFALLNGNDPDEYFKDMTNWNNGNDNKIDYIIKHSDTIRSLHLNGGEPWMQEATYELLEEMLKRGLNKHIQVWSHTNGSITKSYKGVDIIDEYLVHWGDLCKITISNDGHGARGAYTRFGYKESKWLETYNRILDSGIKQVSIQTCWNVFNAQTITDTAEFFWDNCRSHKGEVYGSLTPWYNTMTTPLMLCYVRELRLKAVEQLEQLMQNTQIPSAWGGDLKKYWDYLHRWEEIDSVYRLPNSNSALLNWYAGIQALDAKRKTNLCTTFPELEPLYELAATETERQMDQTHCRIS